MFCRAVNNELIDTYQLKSLDGLVEARLEKIVIAQQKEQGRKRSGGEKKEKRGRLYLTLKKYVNTKNSSDVTREELPGHHIDNFPMRKPYDRVIRCLGFRFNFSIFDGYELRQHGGRVALCESLSVHSSTILFCSLCHIIKHSINYKS